MALLKHEDDSFIPANTHDTRFNDIPCIERRRIARCMQSNNHVSSPAGHTGLVAHVYHEKYAPDYQWPHDGHHKGASVVVRVQNIIEGVYEGTHLVASGQSVAIKRMPGSCKGVVQMPLKAVHMFARAQIHNEGVRVISNNHHERAAPCLARPCNSQVDWPLKFNGAASIHTGLIHNLEDPSQPAVGSVTDAAFVRPIHHHDRAAAVAGPCYRQVDCPLNLDGAA